MRIEEGRLFGEQQLIAVSLKPFQLRKPWVPKFRRAAAHMRCRLWRVPDGHAFLDREAEAVYALGDFFSAYDLSADDALRFFFDDEFDFDGFGAWEIICFGFAADGACDDFDAVACRSGFS